MAPINNRGLDKLDGPYEAWVFGTEGQSFASAGERLSNTSFVAALAELPATHELFKISKLDFDEQRTAYRPTIWQDLPIGGFGATFLPLILELNRADRPNQIADLRDFMIVLATGSFPAFLDGRPKPHHGFRLNAPLRPRTFDGSFASSGREPTLLPKPGLREAQEEGTDRSEPLAILAVIDDGLAYAHPGLRDAENEPRMEFCWLQSADIAPSEDERTVLFGREHTRHTLSKLLKQAGDDEDAFYRAAGSIRRDDMGQTLAGLSSHGAHVLNLAAGPFGDGDLSELERIRLIGVELPSPVVMDTVGFGKDAYILSAFHYIFDRADRIAKAYGRTEPLPLVINFSFGFTGGPHDGTDRLEDAINDLICARNESAPTDLVMPAGNQFLSALNGEIGESDVDEGGRFSIPWRIQPNDQTANYLEIWYPLDDDKFSSAMPEPPTVKDPSGRCWKAVKPIEESATPPQKIWQLKFGERVVGQVSIDKFRDCRWRAMVVLAPTESSDSTVRGASAGLWQIDVDARGLDNGKVMSCRIQRDHSIPHPLHRGRQSYFDHPGAPQFASNGTWLQDDGGARFVRRFGSLNGLATGKEVVVVAGAVAQSAAGPDLPAPYSAAGRLDDPSSKVVTCAATSDFSPVLSGIRAGGTRSGSAWRIAGTSAAAPQIARSLALDFVRGSGDSLRPGNGSLAKSGISARVPLKPLPSRSPQQRLSGTDPLEARLGAGVLVTRVLDG